MAHSSETRSVLAIILGLTAASANVLGGYFVVRREWPRHFLKYFLALGAGFMLAAAFVEILPESLRLAGEPALFLVLGGFFLVHLFEHTLAPHFHFGEETHHDEMTHRHAGGICAAGVGRGDDLRGGSRPAAGSQPRAGRTDGADGAPGRTDSAGVALLAERLRGLFAFYSPSNS